MQKQRALAGSKANTVSVPGPVLEALRRWINVESGMVIITSMVLIIIMIINKTVTLVIVVATVIVTVVVVTTIAKQ